MPENRHNFKKTELPVAGDVNAEVKKKKNLKTIKTDGSKKKKKTIRSRRPIVHGQMFCRKVVMTVWGVRTNTPQSPEDAFGIVG